MRLHWLACSPVVRPSSVVVVAAAFASGTSFVVVVVAFAVFEVDLVEHTLGSAAWDSVAYAA